MDVKIRLFDELGADYFHVLQLAYLTPAEYRAIAPRIGAEGLEANGEAVPLVPENRDRIAAILGEVRAKARGAPTARQPDRFALPGSRRAPWKPSSPRRGSTVSSPW